MIEISHEVDACPDCGTLLHWGPDGTAERCECGAQVKIVTEEWDRLEELAVARLEGRVVDEVEA